MRYFAEVKEYLARHPEVKTVSFDLFDTLIFRKVYEQADVFELVGRKVLDLNASITAEEYKYIRKRVEILTREKRKQETGSTEVTLKEIIENIPSWVKQGYDLEIAEFEVEKEVCFANPEVMDFLMWCEQEKYTIIYVSDMYLTPEQLQGILEKTGVPSHELFVSCVYSVSKWNGGLYDSVLEELAIRPYEIIHIGDNMEADIYSCGKKGICSFWYDSRQDINYTITAENFVKGKLLPEIYVLRHIASASGYAQCDKRRWFALGASIYGPLMAYFMDWLCSQVQKNQDNHILFLMREGAFLKKAWEMFCKYRNIGIESSLAYVSRRSLLLASIEEWDEKAFKEVISSKKITVGEVCRILGLKIENVNLKEYADVPRAKFELVKVEDRTLLDKLKEIVFLPANVRCISAHILEEKKQAYKYLCQFGLVGKTATVDIGYQGTIQKRMEAVLSDRKEVNWDHYLLFCNGETRLKEFAERNNIYGALGTYSGTHSQQMTVIDKNNRSLEMLFLSSCGSTEGYRYEEDRVVPILGKLLWDERQSEKIRLCQEGALHFLELYLKIGVSKIEKSELLLMLNRLLMNPNFIEAKMLGNLVFDENHGSEYYRKICTDAEIDEYRKEGNFFASVESQWPEGVRAIAEPGYLLNYESSFADYLEVYACNLVKQLCKKKIHKINIVAAGVVGKLTKRYAAMCGIETMAFIDNNKELWGSTYHEVPIICMEASDGNYPYVVATICNGGELVIQIKAVKGKNAVVIA